MKKILLLPFAIAVSFCCTKKNAPPPTEELISNSKKIENCPDGGTCTIEIIKNKSLLLKYDDIGAMYLQQQDNPETSIVVYQYNKNVPKGLQDANYREEIQFEISNKDVELNLSNLDLQKTKMVFGRYCFCKGQTGTFKVEEGNLILSQKNGQLTFNLSFKNNKVPQILTSISY